jgi:WD40 repeat protein
MQTLSKMFAPWGDSSDSYYYTKRPHDNTSLLARFRDEIPPPDLSDASPSSRAVFQARVEITSALRHMPIQLSLPINSPHLAFLQTCGNNGKSPLLSLFYCDVEAEYFCKEVTVNPGLVGVATHIASDAERKLIWIADDDRIKSFSTVDGAGLLRRHTLRSRNSGPIALVENGSRILRAGMSGIETWNVDSLCTHGSTGKRRIGPGKLELPEFTWHDECDMEDLEFSTGQMPDSTVTNITHDPRIWSPFHNTQSMLVAPVDSYSCLSVDLAAGYAVTNRYLGHGGNVHCFSTSPADANSFLTACSDGIIRLFDVRENLPRLSIDVGAGNESISSALYVHVDGLPR